MSLALDEDIVEATLLKWTGGNVPTRLRSAGITAVYCGAAVLDAPTIFL